MTVALPAILASMLASHAELAHDNDFHQPTAPYDCHAPFRDRPDLWLPVWELRLCGLHLDNEIFGKHGARLRLIDSAPFKPPLDGPPGHAAGSPATAEHSTLPDWSHDRDVPRDVSRVH